VIKLYLFTLQKRRAAVFHARTADIATMISRKILTRANAMVLLSAETARIVSIW